MDALWHTRTLGALFTQAAELGKYRRQWEKLEGREQVQKVPEKAQKIERDTWRKIYKDVAESQEREDEMVRALRRSGVRRL